eukprot:CFRG4681T1
MIIMQPTMRAVMVQGTASDVGKSTVVTGLCRALKRQGIKVAPFKSQNMALNSAVTADGGEIGRAQAVQAYACGIIPTVHMNPVLLKPDTEASCQVIVQGKVMPSIKMEIGKKGYKAAVMGHVMESFSILLADYDTIIVEGAGSPAEINIRDNDIANNGFAEAADISVIIVADIDKGGVFASLYGTLMLISESERARVKGFVINRFRGDIDLLQPGLDWLEEKTGIPVLGVLPYIYGLMLEAEDSIDTKQFGETDDQFRVTVLVLTRTSNHTDFDPLRMHPQINLQFVRKGTKIPRSDLIIIPGTKSVRHDLAFLRQQKWDKDIQRHLRLGGKVMGICGGYQMLGSAVFDPDGIEGVPGESVGLGYLDSTTILLAEKQLKLATGTIKLPEQSTGVPVKGYEIHAGVTTVNIEHVAPILLSDGHADGQVGLDNQVFGTYLHGIFEQSEACDAILSWAGCISTQSIDFDKMRDESIEKLADVIETHLDLDKLWPELSAKFFNTQQYQGDKV